MTPPRTTLTARRRGPVAPSPGAGVLTPLPLDAVRLDPAHEWGARQERNGAATLPHCTAQLEASGTLDNFRRLVGESGAPFRGMPFQDSDLYKHLEALAWEHARSSSPETDAEIEAGAALVGRVQDADGYLNTPYQGTDRERYALLAQDHEHYSAGHLLQAAVADHRATGSRRLLDVATRLADHLVATFGDERRRDYDGHPGVETALVELYRETGTRAYLDLARQFVTLRGGRIFTTGPEPTAHYGRVDSYYVDHEPRRTATTIEGHAVRAMYLEAGVVDVAVEDADDELLQASITRWEQMVAHKLYLTGGAGSRHSTEGFGDPDELPPDRAYAETCAAIAAIHWSWRLQLATGDPRYADLIETVLHNAFAVGTGLDGTSFRYANPLQLRAGHVADTEEQTAGRLPWYACACCPPNIARLVATVHTYAAAVGADGVHLAQYLSGRYDVGTTSARRVLAVVGDYPWDGSVAVRVVESDDAPWDLHLRVPAWCGSFTVTVNGTPVEPSLTATGEVRLSRRWSAGDEVGLLLDMPARFVEADPRVDALRGAVAVQRGPVVYCLESVDQPGVDLADVVVSVSTPPSPATAVGLAAPALRLAGRRLPPRDARAYTTARSDVALGEPVDLAAVPYHLWGNRGAGAMRVFVPRAR